LERIAPIVDGLPDPDQWREKAIATRLRAQEMTDPEARRVTTILAFEYDELADAIELEIERGTLPGAANENRRRVHPPRS
jgi:hypothetical protein